MKKVLVFVYGILILLTVTTALVSNVMVVSQLAIALIMGLSVLKFFLVSFEFMELKKANSFWKGSLISVLGLIVLSILFIRISS
nr:cytochrome C oxidase subunit IV family protein [uncultured Flavobacterium sp.]